MDQEPERLLVVGAQEGSLGAAVAEWGRRRHYNVVTAGLAGKTSQEDIYLDVVDQALVQLLFENWDFDHVICTAGINLDGNSADVLEEQLDVNCVGHARVLEQWVASLTRNLMLVLGGVGTVQDTVHHFISVSSNSAHRPRSRSAGYCASKAALSMYMRSVARAAQGSNIAISLVEPGWIEGTPMSQSVSARLNVEDKGLDKSDLAEHLVSFLSHGTEWNGVALRLDNGEI